LAEVKAIIMKQKDKPTTIIYWLFTLVFLILGLLNAFLVHIVPGLIYSVLAAFYFPPAIQIFQKYFSLSIPLFIRIIFGLVVLWGTLAVGDLMEIFESWLLR
jgi:hypothetical protein